MTRNLLSSYFFPPPFFVCSILLQFNELKECRQLLIREQVWYEGIVEVLFIGYCDGKSRELIIGYRHRHRLRGGEPR